MFRKLKRNKAINKMSDAIIRMIGKDDYGTFLAVLADSLCNLVGDVDGREIRTVEIKYNDYFSTKFDFSTRRYIEE